MHCYLFFCLHFAAGCYHLRRILRGPFGFQFGRVRVFPKPSAGLLQSPPQTPFPPGFIVDAAGKLRSPIGEKNVAFELIDILGKSPRISPDASLLFFSLLLRFAHKFHSVVTALMRKIDMYFTKRLTFIFSDNCLTPCSPLVNRSRRIGPKTFVPFRKIAEEILAAQRPAIHNSTDIHLMSKHSKHCVDGPWTCGRAIASFPASASG